MSRSQENCLIDNHRMTCEGWGGDLPLAYVIVIALYVLSAVLV